MANLVNRSFWRGRRVLVTGHTGFSGAWLALWLDELGAEVTGLALPAPTDPALFDLADVGSSITSITGDIRDSAAVVDACGQCRPEVVFHLAAQSLVRRSYVEPLETYDTNVMGTVRLLEAIRQTSGVRAVVIVTSDKCYRSKEQARGYVEDDRVGGKDPYSGSKAAAELAVETYRHAFMSAARSSDTRVATARAGNLVAGGDWAEDRIIPDSVRALTAHRPLELRYPGATRPWQHVLEALHGYMVLAERLCLDGDGVDRPWNFGPDPADVHTVKDVVELFFAAWGANVEVVVTGDQGRSESAMLHLDSSAAQKTLGWSSKWQIEQAIEATASWYRAWTQGAEMRALTVDQIRSYDQGRTS